MHFLSDRGANRVMYQVCWVILGHKPHQIHMRNGFFLITVTEQLLCHILFIDHQKGLLNAMGKYDYIIAL